MLRRDSFSPSVRRALSPGHSTSDGCEPCRSRRSGPRTPASAPARPPSGPAGRWRRSRARWSAARTAPPRAKRRLVEVSSARARVLGHPGGLPHRHHAGLRYRRLRVRDVDASLGARGVDVLAFESFGEGWLTDIEKQLQPLRPAAAQGPVRRAARPRRGRSGARHGLLLERHHLRRARPRRRLDPRRPRGPHALRRHLGRLRDGAALAQARCRHLVLAEGAGRRGAARHAGPLAAGGGAARSLQARLAAAQDLPPDQGRQADRGHLPGRDHQHALDARGRGRARRPRLGRAHRRPAGAGRARRAQPRRGRGLGRAQRLGRLPGRAARDPLADLGLPHASPTPPSPRWTPRRSRPSSRT